MKKILLTGIILSALVVSCKYTKLQDSSGFVVNETGEPISGVFRDSTLNGSDKLHFFDNDSIEMRRDGRLMYTQYLNRRKGEIIYRYYDYHGPVQREVYSMDMDMAIGQLHFRYYNPYVSESIENKGYLSAADSIPDLLKEDLGEYWRIGVIKAVQNNELLSERYILWRSSEDCIAGQNEDYIGEKQYYDDNSYEIEKYTDSGTDYWHYYPNGQLKEHWINEGLYGATFSTFFVSYDSLGYKTKEINWEHSFPEWGISYNHTFSVETTQKYYQSGKLKSLTKKKSFCEQDSYRCGTWVYYDEQGKVQKTETYGDCYSFELEEKYNEVNYEDEKKSL